MKPKLTPEEESEINTVIADFMGVDWTGASYPSVMPQDWQYCKDANLMNKVIEKMKISCLFDERRDEWVSNSYSNGISRTYYVNDKDRTTSIIKCVCSVLNVDKVN